jgi:hypothetical protein
MEIIYSYKIIPLEISGDSKKDKSKLNKIYNKTKTEIYRNVEFSGYNLPSTMDYQT